MTPVRAQVSAKRERKLTMQALPYRSSVLICVLFCCECRFSVVHDLQQCKTPHEY